MTLGLSPKDLVSLIEQTEKVQQKLKRKHFQKDVEKSVYHIAETFSNVTGYLDEFKDYMSKLVQLCQGRGLNYAWAPEYLFLQDFAKVYGMPEQGEMLFLARALHNKLEPVLFMPVPPLLLLDRKALFKSVTNVLKNRFPGFPTRLAYKIPQHMRWLYEHKANNLSPCAIAGSLDLTADYGLGAIGYDSISKALRLWEHRLQGLTLG